MENPPEPSDQMWATTCYGSQNGLRPHLRGRFGVLLFTGPQPCQSSALHIRGVRPTIWTCPVEVHPVQMSSPGRNSRALQGLGGLGAEGLHRYGCTGEPLSSSTS